MALKDWKKDERFKLLWRPKLPSKVFVHIVDDRKTHDKGWTVYIGANSKGRVFKTKSAALKYTKSYMRKH